MQAPAAAGPTHQTLAGAGQHKDTEPLPALLFSCSVSHLVPISRRSLSLSPIAQCSDAHLSTRASGLIPSEQLRGAEQHSRAARGASAPSCCHSASKGQPLGGHLWYRCPSERKELPPLPRSRGLQLARQHHHSKALSS